MRNLNNQNLISQIRESREAFEHLKNYVTEFLNKYNTTDIVFGWVNGQPGEVCEGYMDIRETFVDINDAFESMTPTDSIRVVEDNLYQIGRVKGMVSDCHESLILDVRNLVIL